MTSGCPGPATLSELANSGELPRQAMTRSIERHIASLLPGMPGADTREKRQQAIALLGLCMGGLALARAVDDQGLSDEIVRACRNIASKIGEDAES